MKIDFIDNIPDHESIIIANGLQFIILQSIRLQFTKYTVWPCNAIKNIAL